MKYTYYTASETIDIEVDERLHSILSAMDKEGDNSNRKHYRHNRISLSNADYDGDWIADRTDILGDLIDSETVICALSCLTERQRNLITKCCLEGRSYVDLAAQEGVTESAIRHAVERAKERLKKFLP